jgi:hypothetical protein
MADQKLPEEGAASKELMLQAHQWWVESARLTGVNVTALSLNTPLQKRIAWAIGHGFSIGTGYSRFSTNRQDSTEAQVRTYIQHAATHKIYVPPEFICVDEARKGRSQRRPGLERMKFILESGMATIAAPMQGRSTASCFSRSTAPPATSSTTWNLNDWKTNTVFRSFTCPSARKIPPPAA